MRRLTWLRLLMERACWPDARQPWVRRPHRFRRHDVVRDALSVLLFSQGLMKNMTPYFRESCMPSESRASDLPLALLRFAIAAFQLIRLLALMSRTELLGDARLAQNPKHALQGIGIGKISMLAMTISAPEWRDGWRGHVAAVRNNPADGPPVLVNALIVMIVGGMGSSKRPYRRLGVRFPGHPCLTTISRESRDNPGLALMLLVLNRQRPGSWERAGRGLADATAIRRARCRPGGRLRPCPSCCGLSTRFPDFHVHQLILVVSYRLIAITGSFSWPMQ